MSKPFNSLVLGAVLLAVVASCVVYLVLTFEFFPALDYSVRHKDPAELLRAMEIQLGPELPESSCEPHMYNDGGRDPTIWALFRVPLTELADVKAGLGTDWEDELGDLPRTPPEAIKSWWAVPSTGISVLKNEAGPPSSPPGLKGQCWIVDEATGRAFVCDYSW